TRQPELSQETLHPLPRVADQGARGDALGRAGIGGDAQHARTAVSAAAMEDRPPVVPEMPLQLAVVRAGREDPRERPPRALVELDHHVVSVRGRQPVQRDGANGPDRRDAMHGPDSARIVRCPACFAGYRRAEPAAWGWATCASSPARKIALVP